MKKILVTGGAGFIGSNLIEGLLAEDYQIICLDNLSTGSFDNISGFIEENKFRFVEGDILDSNLVDQLVSECSLIVHLAALGSVPRSINDPVLSNRVNVEGTLNIFKAAVDNDIERVVYAASSSTYGDSQSLPKIEDKIGKPLSPYAVTKYVNELYADVFNKVYGLNTIGLRYFNVFGPKQNPNGPYAAVIPLFINAVLNNQSPRINGDGEHSRDFTFVGNAVEANIQAICAPKIALNNIYNVACGDNTTLNKLFEIINRIGGSDLKAEYGPERPGDVKHSLADISKAKNLLGYEAKHNVVEGLKMTFDWYKRRMIHE